MRRFFHSLNYTSVNEDWRTEAAALRLGADDDVLCVTGAGDRPLHMLLRSPRRVVAIDLNPAQNDLLLLKVAALRHLPFGEYIAFLGLHPAPRGWRVDTLLRLTDDLPGPARDYWRGQSRSVSLRGVLYAGRWERYYRRLSRWATSLRPRLVASLFDFDDLAAQRRFVRDVWDTPFWRGLHRVVCSPIFSRIFLRDPAYYAHVGRPAGAHIYERMKSCLERTLARDSFMVSLVLRGRLSPFDLPPYLTEEGAGRIRPLLDRLEIVTEDVVAHLGSAEPGAYSRLSLSDVPSFLDAPRFGRLLDGVARAGRPGARFCVRQFLTRHAWPPSADGRLTREPDMEARLRDEDRAFAYDFLVGQVR